MPDREVKTIRHLIYYQYAKIIAKSAFGYDSKSKDYGFIKKTFRDLVNSEKKWSEIIREDKQFVKYEEKCIYCGSSEKLQWEHIVPKTININERCSTCDKVQGIHNMIWSCEDCNFPSDATKSISIVFNNSSDVLSFSGLCNNGSGTYTYSSITGVIKVTDLATTLIGCKYVEWETYTVQNMYHASSYKINGNNLAIYSNSEYNLYFTKN